MESSDSLAVCHVSDEAAHLRWQATFFESLELPLILHNCSNEVWEMPTADRWRQTLLGAIRSIELHCEALRVAALRLEQQALSGGSNGSAWW